MIIVLDTNVVVSGLLRPHSKPATVLRLEAAGVLRVAYDERILAEYRPPPRFCLIPVDTLSRRW